MIKALFEISRNASLPTLALWLLVIAFAGVLALAFGRTRQEIRIREEVPFHDAD